MRLIDLTIRNFRGFGPAVETIDLSGDLVLLYGPNGHGKTSLAEAIEWLFYGTTKRRRRGEEFSRSEYAGTFANAHGKKPTDVVLRVTYGGRTLTLSRQLGDKETSTTFVDGQLADFGAVGILPLEAHYPVVAQHGLQTFVHSKPKDRRDAICAALGLEELTSLKSALESARSSFQRTPPLAVTEARVRLAELAPGLAKVPSLAKLSMRWSATPTTVLTPGDEQALVTAAATLASEPAATVDEALVVLRTARQRASKSVFDLTPIEPQQDHDGLRNDAESKIEELIRASTIVDDRVSELAGAMASTYGVLLLGFWKQGLELAPSGEECPMCEAPTLAVAQREKLEQRLREATATINADSALMKATMAWEQTVAPVGKSVAAIGLPGIDDAEKLRFGQLVGDSADTLRFLGAHDGLISARRKSGQALRKGNELGRSTKERTADHEGVAVLIRERQTARDEIAATTRDLLDALDTYKTAWDQIKDSVAAKIAADEIVAQIDAVGKALRVLAKAGLLSRYAGILDETQALIRLAAGSRPRGEGPLCASKPGRSGRFRDDGAGE
jgi:energy-coupling factor transporter ATP-binding protein EcfA2